MKNLKFILSGGGTGGHIYPAIAIADELKHRYDHAQFLFVGAEDRMEMQKVPKAGYEIKGLWISGIQRKLSLKNLIFPVKLIYSLMKSLKIIEQFQPDVVIGTGGFASGPLLKAANRKGIPTLLQEQNSYPGMTNKWLAKDAAKICVAYENMEKYFPSEKIVFTGNPVRRDLLHLTDSRSESLSYFQLDAGKKTVLVLGGSLGARVINETIARHLEFFVQRDVQLIWQCGKLYYGRFRGFDKNPSVQVYQFLDRMDLAYAAADVVISRSGAIAVSELCLVGKPVLFIPSPNVAEDHQTKNANALADESAAVVVKENELEEKFEKELRPLLESEEKQNVLSKNIKKRAKPKATSEIVDEIAKIVAEK